VVAGTNLERIVFGYSDLNGEQHYGSAFHYGQAFRGAGSQTGIMILSGVQTKF
jgi:hypothetical protein